jgi:putative dimethyl sulfoxide reductase chaperone
MPIPSEPTPHPQGQQEEKQAPRSVFNNFQCQAPEPESFAASEQPALSSASSAPDANATPAEALARAFLHRFLAKAFEYPTSEGWLWLTNQQTLEAVWSALDASVPGSTLPLRERVREFLRHVQAESFDRFLEDHIATFGHAARGPCPCNEIEYGDLKADPLFQPHRLADLAAFYHAFGLDVAADATERHDHISVELEFMSVLAAKEAFALECQLIDGQWALCRDAQKMFLREHLGRWTPAFTQRLAKAAGVGALGALAALTGEWIITECHRFGLEPGSQDLVLRPVNAAAESLCSSCGLDNLPPGALHATAQI